MRLRLRGGRGVAFGLHDSKGVFGREAQTRYAAAMTKFVRKGSFKKHNGKIRFFSFVFGVVVVDVLEGVTRRTKSTFARNDRDVRSRPRYKKQALGFVKLFFFSFGEVFARDRQRRTKIP